MTALADVRLADRLAVRGVVPVVAVETVDEGVRLADALVAGGLPVVEVTFRTRAAAAAIAAIVERAPHVLVGAGTLLSPDDVHAAIDAGAGFGVAPGLREPVVETALAHGLPFAPGVATASEIERGMSYGLDLFKLFPAEASGGLPLIDALAGPYPRVRFMPTGGISPANLDAYLRRPTVVACGGTWIAPRSVIEVGDFDEITRRAATAVQVAQQHSTTGKDDL